MRRLLNKEREMRIMKEVLESIMGKCEVLERENKEMESKFWEYKHITETDKEMEKELEVGKKKMRSSKKNVVIMMCNSKI